MTVAAGCAAGNLAHPKAATPGGLGSMTFVLTANFRQKRDTEGRKMKSDLGAFFDDF
jgi:hypothetical protein